MNWAAISADDCVFELGCGDGRVAIEAARRGAAAFCVEKDLSLAAEAQSAFRAENLTAAQVIVGDLFDVNLAAANATVVFMFLTPSVNARLKPSLSLLQTGARIISREYEILGWPCGKRFRHSGALFLRWTLGEFDSAIAMQSPPPEVDDSLEGLAVEHQLDCAVEEELREAEKRRSEGKGTIAARLEEQPASESQDCGSGEDAGRSKLDVDEATSEHGRCDMSPVLSPDT